MNTEHVLMIDITADVALLQCSHCGDQHCPALPMSAALLADRLLGFVRMHRSCPKPMEPSKQVELFDALALAEDDAKECAAFAGVTDQHRGISALTDEPAPEIDPPGSRDVFAEMYPMARTSPLLWADLVGWALTPEQGAHLLHWPVPAAGSPDFDELAHWCRCSKAHSERQAAKQRGVPSISGLYVPAIPPMPKALREALGNLAPKKKRSPKKAGQTA